MSTSSKIGHKNWFASGQSDRLKIGSINKYFPNTTQFLYLYKYTFNAFFMGAFGSECNILKVKEPP